MTSFNRMGIAALALVGVLISTYMLLYKMGVIPTVICGESGGCAVVQSSRYASFLGIPVAGWGLGGYLVILLVALFGVQPAYLDARWVSLGLLGLTGVAFLFSVYLSVLEEFVIGAWCRWCIASAIVATISFLLAWPELRRLRRPPTGV